MEEERRGRGREGREKREGEGRKREEGGGGREGREKRERRGERREERRENKVLGHNPRNTKSGCTLMLCWVQHHLQLSHLGACRSGRIWA